MTAADRPSGPHPDLDILADLDAGVLDRQAAGRVAAHVAACSRCSQVVTALGTVRADLRSLPTPPMPDAVARRLDATVAGLHVASPPATHVASPSAARVASPPGAGDTGTAAAAEGAGQPTGESAARQVEDLDAARERRRRRRLRTTTGAVAAAVAVLAAGASVTALVRNAGSHNSAVSAGSAASASYDGRAAGPAKQAPQAQPNASAATAGIPSYSRETLRGSLAAIERESTLAATSKLGETGPAGAMADAARRQACAQTIVGHPGELRAVRRISYEGVPSYLFVFDDGQPHGYVVDLQCGTSGGLPATILDRVP